jgi:hypothetical protein
MITMGMIAGSNASHQRKRRKAIRSSSKASAAYSFIYEPFIYERSYEGYYYAGMSFRDREAGGVRRKPVPEKSPGSVSCTPLGAAFPAAYRAYLCDLTSQ